MYKYILNLVRVNNPMIGHSEWEA